MEICSILDSLKINSMIIRLWLYLISLLLFGLRKINNFIERIFLRYGSCFLCVAYTPRVDGDSPVNIMMHTTLISH